MKKTIITLMALCAITTSAFAQTQDRYTGDDIRLEAEGEDLAFTFGGYKIKLGEPIASKPQKSRYRSSVSFDMVNDLELGFAPIVGIDYGDDPFASSDYLDTKTCKSVHFGFNLAQLNANLTRHFGLFTGIRLDAYDYAFKNGNTLLYDGVITPGNVYCENYKKSVLNTCYWNVPVGFTYCSGNVKINTYVFCGVLASAKTMYKKPKVKNRDFGGVNGWQYGVGLSISVDDIGMFVKYVPSPIFKDGKGPEAQTVSFGIII